MLLVCGPCWEEHRLEILQQELQRRSVPIKEFIMLPLLFWYVGGGRRREWGVTANGHKVSLGDEEMS